MVKLSFFARTTSLFALAFVATRLASAQASGEAVRFDYRAPPQCPGEEAFTSRVQARTTRARIATPGELARTFVVEVTSDDSGSSARLSFTDARGAPIVRAVRGETCDEVVSAIALVTALAVEAEPTEGAEPAEKPATPPSPVPVPVASAEPAPQRRAPLPSPKPDAVAVSVGLQGSVTSWLGPPPNLGVGAFADVGTYTGPSGRITLLRFTSHALLPLEDAPTTFRGADFTAFVARLEGCPVVAVLGSGFRLLPCIGLGLGALEGAGEESEALSPTSSKTIFWADAVPLLRLDWTLADSLVFFGQAELGIPLISHEFFFEGPHESVFEVPRVGGGVSFGAAWRFP